MISSAFATLGAVIERHPLVTLGVALVLLVAAFGGAAQITSVTGNDAFTAENPTLERFQDTFDRSTVAVLVRGQVTDPRTMRAIDRFDRRLSARENVQTVTSPADRVRAAYGEIPGDEERIARVVGNEDTVFVTIVLDTGLSQEEQRPVYTDAVDASEWAQFPAGVDVIVTGQAAFSSQLSAAIQSSTQQQLGLAVGLMIVALFFLFRGVRLRLLPVVAVFVGVIYTFGAIGYAGIPNSTLTSAVFPILIGLGIDYSVQFHERYEEELARAPPREALPRALSAIGPAVFIAMLAAALGFGATWISTLDSPAFVWFAQTSIFGVILTFLTALIVLTPVLTIWARVRGRYGGQDPKTRAATAADGGERVDDTEREPADGPTDDPDRPAPADGVSAADEGDTPGRFGRALGTGSRALASHPVLVLVLAALLTTGGVQASTQLDTLADTEEFIPQDLPALLDLEQFRAQTGGGSAVQFDVLVAGGVTQPETLRWMEQFDRVAMGTPSVVGVETPAEVVMRHNDGRIPETEAGVERALARAPATERQRFVDDGYGRIVVVSRPDLSTEGTLSFISNVRSALQFSQPPPGVDAQLTGTDVVSTPSTLDQIESRNTTTVLGFGFVFVALLLYYRDLTRAIAPVVPMAFVVGWQGLYMYGLGIRVSPLGASLGALTVGIGAEYTVIVMERYYEEVEQGASPLDAVETAATRVGKAISVSGMTTVFGFSALAASPFPIIADFGFLTVGVIALTLVAALATLPPTLVILDRIERAVGRRA
ncbi:MAG: putative hydrophobe/Amphiphile Efflux-3 (HAE3) family protein [uncultured archaeon A07HB70]|nr:MAG: putative hydrophobe/Amphiphile Efflux-3 (HAE3) family protein [uncultured archaeon A07HB70]